MFRKSLARATSKRHNVRLIYFYLAIHLYNVLIVLNMGSRVRTITDNLRIFIAPILIKANPFATNPVQPN